MKKSTIWIIVAAVIVIGGYCWTTYNSFVKLGTGVESAWANVETQYQRRADLIPNLVSTVKGYAKHEQETLDQVVEARAKALAGGANIEDYAAAQQQVTTALGRLIAIAENYPDLKANTNFLELQAQLEGTENRITVARNNYNDVVREEVAFRGCSRRRERTEGGVLICIEIAKRKVGNSDLSLIS